MKPALSICMRHLSYLVLLLLPLQISAKRDIFPPPELTPPNPEGLAPIAVEYFSSSGCIDRGANHTATFQAFMGELERKEKPPGRSDLPRGVHERAYAGSAQWWNARAGVNLTQAVRAMLGDPFAYYESPLFLVYKMLSLNQSQLIPEFVYFAEKGHWPSANGTWPPYLKSLIFDILPTLEASNITLQSAGLSEAQAVCSAKRRMDDRFSRMSRVQIDDTYFLHLNAMLGEDPYDAVFSTVYQGIANAWYGAEVIVIAPDARSRGVDLNFYQDRYCPDIWCDYGEVLTPGYVEPNRIIGYQMGDWNVRAPGEHGSHALKYAFYKVEAYSESYVLILGPQELDHLVYCIDQHPDGRFVECLPDTYEAYEALNCTSEKIPPFPTLTNTTIPTIGIIYKSRASGVDGHSRIDTSLQERKVQAVLEKYRYGGALSNQTLRAPLPPGMRRLVENVPSTDGASFSSALWTVDMVRMKERPIEGKRAPAREPPLVVIVILSLASVVGDLLGQRATRRHYKSTRRMILVSMIVSAFLVLLLGCSAQSLFPKQTGRLTVQGQTVQCYREALEDSPGGKTQAFCTDRPFDCTPVDCPAQGPWSLWAYVSAQPLLLLLGLLATVYHVCEVILHLHPLGVLFKPLAAFLATFIIVPLAGLSGYDEQPIPVYIMVTGSIGTYLCLHESSTRGNDESAIEMTTRGGSLKTGTLLATSTLGDNMPVSEHYHENEDVGGSDLKLGTSEMQTSGYGRFQKEAAYNPVAQTESVPFQDQERSAAEEVEESGTLSDERSDEDEALLDGALSHLHRRGGRHSVNRHRSGFPFLNIVLLPSVFLVLVMCLAVWVVAQKLVNDRCRINEFGFTALEVVMPLYMGAFLWICDVLPRGLRQAFLPDMLDQQQSLLQASRQAVTQSLDHRGEALLLVTVQRLLANMRIAVYFWLSINYNLTSVFFESTILRISVSWVSVVVINGLCPGFIDLNEVGERLKIWEGQSGKVVLVKGLGTMLVLLTLLLLQWRG